MSKIRHPPHLYKAQQFHFQLSIYIDPKFHKFPLLLNPTRSAIHTPARSPQKSPKMENLNLKQKTSKSGKRNPLKLTELTINITWHGKKTFKTLRVS